MKRFMVCCMFNPKEEFPIFWEISQLKDQKEWPKFDDITFKENTIFASFAENESKENILKNIMVLSFSSDHFLIPISIINLFTGTFAIAGDLLSSKPYHCLVNSKINSTIFITDIGIEIFKN